MMKLRILSWGNYPELSQWAIMQSECTYKKQTEGDLTQKKMPWEKPQRSRVRERRCTSLVLKIKEEAMSQGMQGMQL